MCRNGIGVVQLESCHRDVYKRSYVHHLFDVTNIQITHALKALVYQYLLEELLEYL